MRYVARNMPVMAALRRRFIVERPLAGLKVVFCSHLEAKTAHAATVLRDAGARVMVCGANALSTRDDIVAALREENDIEVLARHGADPAEFQACLRDAIAWGPDLVADDGGELIALFHSEDDAGKGEETRGSRVLGACEQTTTGVARVRAIAAGRLEGTLALPVVAVNECRSKHLFDNRYGTGESAWTAIAATTNTTLRGRTAVVVGYGHCGRGIAAQGRGMGARVIVTEIDPLKALEALMEGFAVMPLAEAAAQADFVITATGVPGVFGDEAIDAVKDGAFLCNAGHLDGEIDRALLERKSARSGGGRSCSRVTHNVDEYVLAVGDGTNGTRTKTVYLIAGGSIVNVAAGNGHAAQIIDMTFALQASALVYLAAHAAGLSPTLQHLPEALDRAVAMTALSASGASIDRAAGS